MLILGCFGSIGEGGLGIFLASLGKGTRSQPTPGRDES